MPNHAPLIRLLMARQDLTRRQAAQLVEEILRDDDAGWRILAFSVAAQTKGETLDEMMGILDAMGALTGSYPISFPAELMDISSSGGSGVRKINVSTLATLVVGGPELSIAKQSFWGITSVTGSADVLRAVGIEVPALTLLQLETVLREIGIAFLSPVFLSPELANLSHFGQELGKNQVGVSTPFHLAVPIFTPFRLKYRMFGLPKPHQLEMLRDIFHALGYESALAVCGLDGLDEVSLSAPSRLRGFKQGEELDLTLEPEQAGLKTVSPAAVAPEDARSNVRDFLRIAHGVETGPKRDLVALNAGVALFLTARARSIREGVEMAIARLAGGQVGAKLEALVAAVGAPPIFARARRDALGS
jgi:anthranilate phosphoribosyltransferase